MINVEDVLRYLNYLKELSRKIGTKVDFSYIEGKGRRKRQESNFLFIEENWYIEKNVELAHNKKLRDFINLKTNELREDKALFLGIGLLKYYEVESKRFLKDQKRLKIFAPLFVVSLEIDDLSNPKAISLGQIFLNYDLFVKLSSDDEEENSLSQKHLERVELIREIEEKIENAENIEQLRDIAIDYIPQIKMVFKPDLEMRIIKGEELQEDQKDIDYLRRNLEGNFYADLSYVFVSNFPSEISTYNSLKLMIEEIEEDRSFTNKALEKIFSVVFSSKPQRVEKLEDFRIDDDDLEYYLPIPLSNKQKEALENAIRYEVSYIQGPPGTGKSHVITALALLSILKGYKVLIVSQKAPAIRVLYKKLIENLGDKIDYLPFIYYYDEYRGKLKEYISKLALPTYDTHQIISNLKEKVEIEKSRLSSKLKEYKRTLENYKEGLDLDYKFWECRRHLSDEVRGFNERFYKITENIDLYYKNLEESFLEQNYKTFSILEKQGKTRLLLIRKKFFVKEIRKIDKNIDHRLLMNESIADYISKLRNIFKEYKELVSIRSKIRPYLDKLDKDLQESRKKIMEYAKEYLRLINQKRILEKAREASQDLNTFKQILHYNKIDRIKKAKENINWANLLEVFNIWIIDIPNVDRVLPMEPNLFDLVVVDESSQVNLAQVIPVFYRAKRICVVGDHKQLSLESTGLGFAISDKLDSYTWEKYKPGNLRYEEARERRITLTKSSILDFLRENNLGIPEVMLDEHFRSVPSLARFTSREFYENKLYIMTEKPEYELYKAFKEIKTGGYRYSKNSKYVEEEVEKVLEIVKSLLNSRSYEDVRLPDYVPEKFSIGVVCFTREQADFIKIRMIEEVIENNVYVGTPEELQGHEFDVVIISMALDDSSNRSRSHYENKNRFNVATSRAKYFTFLVYGGIPNNFGLTKRYISHFTGEKPNVALDDDNLQFSEDKFESELERVVHERCLKPLKEKFKQEYNIDIAIYNQYNTCGFRLDFVVYNKKNKKFVGLEVDGPHHFDGNGLSNYADWHIERIEKLKRAGWNIINTPYYKWYWKGWLDEDHKVVREELERIRKELQSLLLD